MNAVRFRAAAALALSAACLAGACSAPAARAADAPRITVRIEGAAVWQSLNNVQVPNDVSGTRFSLYDLAGSGPWPAARAYLTWRTGRRHELRALVAPFSITETGVPSQPIAFAGATYASGVPVEATYQFNSYRLSYRYRLYEGNRWTWWTGFTAKVRDAKIELAQGAITSRKTDVGFVPLLHVAADWRFAPSWRLGLDADALAGGPGRAEDVALTLGRDLGDAWTLSAGYRTVEGGADVDEVYAFAWLHYAVVGIECRFRGARGFARPGRLNVPVQGARIPPVVSSQPTQRAPSSVDWARRRSYTPVAAAAPAAWHDQMDRPDRSKGGVTCQ